MFFAVVPDHMRIEFTWYLSGEGKNKSSGKLGVPLLFHFLCSVPERCPVCIFRRGIGWKKNFRVNNAVLVPVIFVCLVIL